MELRNSGSDFGKTHFRDAFMTGLLDEVDIDKQAYRPVHVYINGKYWGIYNIREKVNRFFIADHHDVDKDSIDLLEHKGLVRRGSIRHYRHMLSFIEKKGLRDSANYAYVQKLMEVDNFMDYQIAQIFYDNQDAAAISNTGVPARPAVAGVGYSTIPTGVSDCKRKKPTEIIAWHFTPSPTARIGPTHPGVPFCFANCWKTSNLKLTL
ncbi:MAG: CotH kinase family protein [Saprospiraceae bacterium]|nr:CotH kinase family protein [Saprospiraceae bacterium]